MRGWRWILHPDGAFPMLLAVAFAFLAVLYRLPRPYTVDQRGLLYGAIACTAVTLVFGIAGELRVFLPICTVIALLAVLGANGQTDRQWVDGLFGRRRAP